MVQLTMPMECWAVRLISLMTSNVEDLLRSPKDFGPPKTHSPALVKITTEILHHKFFLPALVLVMHVVNNCAISLLGNILFVILMIP